jgi:hypothetical protein
MHPGGSEYNIETYWKSASDSDVRLTIVDLPSLSANAWYRLRLDITKLTATSVRIEVTLIELDINGDPGAVIVSASISDTSTLGSNAPNSKYFTAASIWSAYKNYIDIVGGADNAYYELITT